MLMAQNHLGLGSPEDNQRTQWEQLLPYQAEQVALHEYVSIAGKYDGVIKHVGGGVSAKDGNNDGKNGDIANHANLDDFGLHIVDNRLYLSLYHSRRDVIKLLNTERILNGDASNRRNGLAPQFSDGSDVSLNTRATRTIRTCDSQYCIHSRCCRCKIKKIIAIRQPKVLKMTTKTKV